MDILNHFLVRMHGLMNAQSRGNFLVSGMQAQMIVSTEMVYMQASQAFDWPAS